MLLITSHAIELQFTVCLNLQQPFVDYVIVWTFDMHFFAKPRLPGPLSRSLHLHLSANQRLSQSPESRMGPFQANCLRNGAYERVGATPANIIMAVRRPPFGPLAGSSKLMIILIPSSSSSSSFLPLPSLWPSKSPSYHLLINTSPRSLSNLNSRFLQQPLYPRLIQPPPCVFSPSPSLPSRPSLLPKQPPSPMPSIFPKKEPIC